MDHSSWITDEQFSDENIFHTRLFPSDFGFIWCFTYDPPDTSPSGGEGKVRFDMNVTGINGMVVAIHAKSQFTGFNSMVYGSTYFNIQVIVAQLQLSTSGLGRAENNEL